MIIIRNTSICPESFHKRLERYIRNQAINGLIVLPEYCELLHVDPGENNVEIKFVKPPIYADQQPD